MFLSHVSIVFKNQYGIEPNNITFLFNVPEEDPKAFVYEASNGDTVSTICCQITERGLLTYEVKDADELEAIRGMKSQSEDVIEEEQ